VAAPKAGKLIAVGMADDKTCPGIDLNVAALAIFDVSVNPLKPTFETCVDIAGGDFGYVHNAHCIKYQGPDKKYKGTNICALFMESEMVLFNLDTLTTINSFTYDSRAYVHQGWFSEDHTTIYSDDELDEVSLSTGTDFSTCYVFDVTDLDATIQPPRTFITPSDHPSIDHDLYIKDGYIYQAAYTSGARIRKILPDKSLEEVAYFDGELTCDCVIRADPGCTCDSFDGTWTHYPYFDSGITIAGGISVGLFILDPQM
jgi:choice-of-anchor B domain-containing protein